MSVRRGLTSSGRPWRLGRGLIALPLVLIAAITVIDINTPTTIHLGPFLVAAPAITASFAGAGVTGAVGVLAVGAQIVIGELHGGLLTPNHQAQIAALVVISVLVTVFRYLRDRRERQLHQVRSVAAAAQEVLLRPLPHRAGRLRIASTYLAAEAEAQIGGDLYAAVPAPGATRLVVGDVRGKGMAAVGEAAVLVGAFRGAAYRNLSLPGVVAHLGNSVYWNTTQLDGAGPESAESFVTALVVDVRNDGPFIEMVNCGHPPPLLLRNGTVEILEVAEPALPLGLTAPSESDYRVERFGFSPGDLLLLYTDGVIEARDRSGTFYPLIDRLMSWNETDPTALVRRLHHDLLRYAGGTLGDDAAVIAIAAPPGAPG
ncbi:serine/threonine-protein phosphatase [Streptomyces sioyaensis]|uniref:Serine/threonine-protein phosphatase n=1 Tax=Streptomyces sioyaensis TaxID=67364 RepID=A0A4Q1QRV2_9ACTN|nr:PP2C family protein-serine/threonine phosphatase [Streptomyces sioyaensis]MBM4796580.1 serine/threonine-protein phosphatase [Streptomyces sioyaensis]RXS64406.1 serine/threonine-protein phosphatase [Streptomyces sioyaensis]